MKKKRHYTSITFVVSPLHPKPREFIGVLKRSSLKDWYMQFAQDWQCQQHGILRRTRSSLKLVKP